MCMYHSFLIHSSANRHLGCFLVLAIVNSTVMNIGVHISFNSGFLSVYARQWDCWVVWQFYFQVFKESSHYFPKWMYRFTFPPAVLDGSLFSTPSPAFTVCRLFKIFLLKDNCFTEFCCFLSKLNMNQP